MIGTLQESESEVDSYIVFDSGSLPENEGAYRKLHEKFAAQLDLLRQDAGDEFSMCSLCGHGANQHQLRGWTEDGQPPPTKGWMICPDESCTCFRTWSLGKGAVGS